MRTRKNKVYLKAEERTYLLGMTRSGKHSAMELNHVNILLDLEQSSEIPQVLGLFFRPRLCRCRLDVALHFTPKAYPEGSPSPRLLALNENPAPLPLGISEDCSR